MRLDDESTWPAEIVQFLDQTSELFDDWEGPTSEARVRMRRPGSHSDGPRFPAKSYDQAIYGLERLLRKHTLESGYHCTRLTDAEIEVIRRNGMQLQNASSLRARIQACADGGLIDRCVAADFSTTNGANDSNRIGMIWFCFFAPHLAGEAGVEGFFRYWGGEALYRWHYGDVLKGAVLQQIGTPCLVVADVPIASLNKHSGLCTKLIRRYFQNRGGDIREDVEHVDYSVCPIPAQSIRQIVQFPGPEFAKLTRCDTWRQPLVEAAGLSSRT